MLSRHADACYWIGRCVERAETTARMLDVHYHAGLETLLPQTAGGDQAEISPWGAVLAVSGCADAFKARYPQMRDREVFYFFAFDPENPNSILSLWSAARENGRCVRDMLASEMWESLNISYLLLQEADLDRVLSSSLHEFFQGVRNASHLFQGISDRMLLLDETRDWIDVGLFLERAGQTARLLDVKYHQLLPATTAFDPAASPGETYGVGGPLDTQGWIAVLKSVSAFEMYRKRHNDGIRPSSIVDFLVLDAAFPASIRYAIGRVEDALSSIGGSPRGEPSTEPERLVGKLRADLTYANAREIILSGLHEFLLTMQSRSSRIGSMITETYLSY